MFCSINKNNAFNYILLSRGLICMKLFRIWASVSESLSLSGSSSFDSALVANSFKSLFFNI